MIPSKAISGETGNTTGMDLLQALDKLRCTGTLVFIQGQGYLLLLLSKGQLQSSYRFAEYQDLQQKQQRFHFQPHESTNLPQLESRFPTSSLQVCRALPDMSSSARFMPDVLELKKLLAHLEGEGFSGGLVIETAQERALVLILDGNIASAQYEIGMAARHGIDALRGFQRLSSSRTTAQIELRPLPAMIVRSLLGFALNLVIQQGTGDLPPQNISKDTLPKDFSGLDVTDTGYTFYQHGQAYLHLVLEPVGDTGRYAAAEQTPVLQLPDEPPGWEHQRYALTLRGRDALNPMTDLAMEFRSTYGQKGQYLLQQLGKQISAEEVAHLLKLELGELKGWLERLEADGLIHQVVPGAPVFSSS